MVFLGTGRWTAPGLVTYVLLSKAQISQPHPSSTLKGTAPRLGTWSYMLLYSQETIPRLGTWRYILLHFYRWFPDRPFSHSQRCTESPLCWDEPRGDAMTFLLWPCFCAKAPSYLSWVAEPTREIKKVAQVPRVITITQPSGWMATILLGSRNLEFSTPPVPFPHSKRRWCSKSNPKPEANRHYRVGEAPIKMHILEQGQRGQTPPPRGPKAWCWYSHRPS